LKRVEGKGKTKFVKAGFPGGKSRGTARGRGGGKTRRRARRFLQRNAGTLPRTRLSKKKRRERKRLLVKSPQKGGKRGTPRHGEGGASETSAPRHQVRLNGVQDTVKKGGQLGGTKKGVSRGGPSNRVKGEITTRKLLFNRRPTTNIPIQNAREKGELEGQQISEPRGGGARLR